MRLDSALKQTVCKLGQTQIQRCRDGFVRHRSVCHFHSGRQDARVMQILVFAMALVINMYCEGRSRQRKLRLPMPKLRLATLAGKQDLPAASSSLPQP